MVTGACCAEARAGDASRLPCPALRRSSRLASAGNSRRQATYGYRRCDSGRRSSEGLR